MTDTSKFNDQNLPPKHACNSKLSEGVVFRPKTYGEVRPSEISDKDYQHAQTVFKAFDCRNLGDYTKLYCKSDVLLLADGFESFIDICLKKYNLDPSHYITAPSLAFDGKMTKVKLQLLTDGDMYLFLKEGIRGGISTITNRYAKSNNKHMGNQYDPSKQSSFIQYLDANNLYGWAMSQPLPVGGFEWLTDEDIKQ